MKVTVLYFARLREALGRDREQLELPAGITTVGALRQWLVTRGTPWAEAFTEIKRVREKVPGFCFMAEVYWDLEWTMQQQGFDYAYDKRLYDRLREHHARPVREHFFAGLDYQNKLARFLENHDEPRAAATFSPGIHQAAAVITFLWAAKDGQLDDLDTPALRILVWFLSLTTCASLLLTQNAFVAAIGSAAIAIGLGAQDLIKNLIGGLVIVADRPYQLGDRLKIGQAYGEVQQIGARQRVTKESSTDDGHRHTVTFN